MGQVLRRTKLRPLPPVAPPPRRRHCPPPPAPTHAHPQVLVTGGFIFNGFAADGERVVFAVIIVVGVSLISVLIGLITDTVNSYMQALSAGSSKVRLFWTWKRRFRKSGGGEGGGADGDLG